ncbi:MAG: hypothetical protein ACOZCL_08435 [Bacillota bacterium]
MINKIGWQGTFTIETNGEKEEINNRVMDAALNELIEILIGNAADIDVKYLALGTSNAAVTDSQTQLGNEIFRTQYINRERSATGEVTSKFVVLDNEAVAQIEEIGIFGGSTATATANTGTLISRILWSRNKSNSEEINFTRVDKVVRA